MAMLIGGKESEGPLLTGEQIEQFNRNGYLMVESLFDAEEMKLLLSVACEMRPGTALFFHCNLLHRSAPNRSPNPRWSLICCYNAARNPCREKPNHPAYRRLEKW